MMNKEDLLNLDVKAIDQSALTGQPLYAGGNVTVWSYFPGVAVSTVTQKYVAGIYAQLLAEARRKRIHREQTPAELRLSLLEEVEKRLVQRDGDDLFLLLAV